MGTIRTFKTKPNFKQRIIIKISNKLKKDTKVNYQSYYIKIDIGLVYNCSKFNDIFIYCKNNTYISHLSLILNTSKSLALGFLIYKILLLNFG